MPTTMRFESCPKCVLVGVRNWFDGPRIGRIRRICADLICENPSDPPNPWSIHVATQIQDTAEDSVAFVNLDV